MYLHPLPPAPAPVDFCSCLIPASASIVSVSHLAKVTQAREAVRGVLSNARLAAAATSSSSSSSSSGQTASSSGAGAYEVKLVSALEDYLPHLIAVYNGTQTDELIWRAEAWFVWPALLSPSSPSSHKLSIGGNSPSSAKHGPFASSSLRFELDHVLILYSLALSNLSLLQFISVGNYEYNKVIMDTQRKNHENILKRGVTFGRKAVEVVQWLMRDLHAPGGSEADGRQDWNEEWHSSRRRLLEGLYALHQLPPTLISLRLLLSPSICMINSTQLEPPPLPKGHPSPSLLAKLYLEIPRLAEEARLNLRSGSGGEVTSSGRRLFGRREGPANASSDEGSRLSSKFKRFGLGSSGKEKDKGQAHRSVSPHEPPLLSSASTNNLLLRNVHETQSPNRIGSSPLHASYSPPALAPVTSRIFSYLDSISILYRSISLKYLAMSVGETGDDGAGGRHAEAVVFLRMAKSELEILSDAPNAQIEDFIGKGESKGLRARLGRKDSSSTDQLEHPEIEQNRNASSHPLVLPSVADLSTKIPTPRALLTFDHNERGGSGWVPPRAAFGRERTDEGEGGFLIGTRAGEETEGKYAGKGAYY